MNHLRELIDLDVASLCHQYGIHPKSKLEMHDLFCKKAKNAVCFDISCVSEIPDSFGESDELPDHLLKLPYETCWFESSDVGEFSGILGFLVTYENYVDTLRCFLYIKSKRQWVQQGTISFIEQDGAEKDCYPADEHTKTLMWSTLFLLRKFIVAMNCTNVHRKEHKPNTALQKARAKRGKQPLFSYWTLELNGRDGGAAQSFGGTHASPRVHLRRGHPRQYAPGKWTWVQPCAVGNRELGMVHKDYVIGKELVAH